jgi:hypothetical protein
VIVKAFGEEIALKSSKTIRIIESSSFIGMRTLAQITFSNGLIEINVSVFANTAVRFLELSTTLSTINLTVFEGIQTISWNLQSFVICDRLN